MKDLKQKTQQLHCMVDIFWQKLQRHIAHSTGFLTKYHFPHETVYCTRSPTTKKNTTSATKNQLNGPFSFIQRVSKKISTWTTWGISGIVYPMSVAGTFNKCLEVKEPFDFWHGNWVHLKMTYLHLDYIFFILIKPDKFSAKRKKRHGLYSKKTRNKDSFTFSMRIVHFPQ